ncbi:MAG: VaFE repeat-containing surface-anchored protein, partial [Propionibacteriaceae bacterium]|nr:VaFE repeat-containing surface-anchored protein [Propionibacteriaceae bacterium]
ITDEVSYEGLIPGVEYELKGKLYDKSTGDPLKVDLDGNGTLDEVTASKKFTPTDPSGKETLEFTFPAAALAGHAVVVFEDLYQDSKKIATHSDITDVGQTTEIPQFKTTATDKLDGDKIIDANVGAVIVDTIKYYNLTPGKTYKAEGTLMDKATGNPILIDGKQVTASKEFKPTTATGTVDIEFGPFDATTLAGSKAVAFEKVYDVTAGGVLIGTHEDITDVDQTVDLEGIRTTATFTDGSKVLKTTTQVVIEDVVEYFGLDTTKTYTLQGTLMDKATGKQILVNGSPIVGSASFQPTASSGSEKVFLSFDVTPLVPALNNPNEPYTLEIVVFEKLYIGTTFIAGHEDINDGGQTVTVIPPVKAPKPLVDIEKWSCDSGHPVGDHDTFDDARALDAETDHQICFTITNIGTEPLVMIKVSDKLIAGVNELENISCDFTKAVDPNQVNSVPANQSLTLVGVNEWKAYVPAGGTAQETPTTGTEWNGPLLVGASFDCTATLPGLSVGQTHSDTATVEGVGFWSGIPVIDSDDWHGLPPEEDSPTTPHIPFTGLSDGMLPLAGIGFMAVIVGFAARRFGRRS